MQKIYFACSVTHAPEDFKKEIEQLKKMLDEKYQRLTVPEEQLADNTVLYKHCTDSIKQCDLVVAECSHPSTGLGFEIAYALQAHKPIIAVAKPDAHVSRFILGISSTLFSSMRYQTLDEVVDAVDKKIEGII